MKKNFLKKWEFFRNLISSIKFFFKINFFQNKLIIASIYLSFLFNLINWIILKIWVSPVDLPIILHYNVYFGVDVLGNWKNVFFSPILGLFLFSINLSLSIYFYKQKERIASYLLLLGNSMLQLCLLVYSISLIIINY
jgi:hypothetical protein